MGEMLSYNINTIQTVMKDNNENSYSIVVGKPSSSCSSWCFWGGTYL